MKIRDRVVELRRVKASELHANRNNWRRHPEVQRAALTGLLNEIGYADALLARQTSDGLELIDGHLRADLTPDATVPVLVLDLDEKEADKLLATLDPLAAMAEADIGAFERLVEGVETSDMAVQGLIAAVAGGELRALAPMSTDELPPIPDDDLYREQYGVIVICEDEADQAAIYERLRDQGLNCRVVVT